MALCLSATLLASTAAQAQWQANWLLGVSSAYSWGDGDVDFTAFNSTTGSLVTFSQGFDAKGWDWGLLGGYQARCNGWLLGLELNVDWQDRDNTENYAFATVGNTVVGNATVSFDRDTVVGLTARLGYEISDWFMPYLRAGVETSEDKISFSSAILVPAAISTANDGERRSWRFVGGVGAEMPVPVLSGLSLRLEYQYHSKGRSVEATNLASDNVTVITASTKQSDNQAKAALVYNFNI